MSTMIAWLMLFLAAGETNAGSISLQVSGLRNNKGQVLVSVFRNAKGFPDQPELAIRKYQLPISNKSSSVEIPDLPAGDYAIAVLHDENSDARMNTNWVGWPKEGFGFSNNAMGVFGPPSFNKARFSVKSATVAQIKARYY